MYAREHSSQAVVPFSAVKVPAAHDSHFVEPFPLLNVPGSHCVHGGEPLKPFVPALQTHGPALQAVLSAQCGTGEARLNDLFGVNVTS